LPGIIGSRIGHQEGSEIVEVDYDPQRVTLAEMVRALRKESSFYSVVAADRATYEATKEQLPDAPVTRAHNKASFIESKHSLRSLYPDLYYLDLTEKQAIALNSWSYFGGKMPDVLSPSQIALRPQLRKRIRASSPPPLHPMREGTAREQYRERLLNWLGGSG